MAAISGTTFAPKSRPASDDFAGASHQKWDSIFSKDFWALAQTSKKRAASDDPDNLPPAQKPKTYTINGFFGDNEDSDDDYISKKSSSMRSSSVATMDETDALRDAESVDSYVRSLMVDLHEQYLFDDQDAGRSIAQVHDKTDETEMLLTMPAERSITRVQISILSHITRKPDWAEHTLSCWISGSRLDGQPLTLDAIFKEYLTVEQGYTPGLKLVFWRSWQGNDKRVIESDEELKEAVKLATTFHQAKDGYMSYNIAKFDALGPNHGMWNRTGEDGEPLIRKWAAE